MEQMENRIRREMKNMLQENLKIYSKKFQKLKKEIKEMKIHIENDSHWVFLFYRCDASYGL